ncbi:MAG: DUF1937 family protein [Candidatus Paceibacterota bacterium]
MKTVFIAGPLSSPDGDAGIERNKKEAQKYQVTLAEEGIYSFCPHVHTIWRGKEGAGISDEFFHDWHMKFLQCCDALAALPGWKESKGTQLDIEEAKAAGLPVFYLDSESDLSEVIEWAKNG